MAGTMEVWIRDPEEINNAVFDLWLRGKSYEDAAARRRDVEGFSPRIVLQDTMDQYRVYRILQEFLQNPSKLGTQNIISTTPEVRRHLIARYYSFDERFMLEIAGKQLSSRLRKDLDDVSENTGISLVSCRRQFDNLRRVFRRVEDQPGQLHDLIASKFMLEPTLAHIYAQLVFICNNRLSLDKKNLTGMPLEPFLRCSQEFMSRWTSWGIQGTTDSDDQDMDRKFLQELRELKPAMMSKDVFDELTILFLRQVSQERDREAEDSGSGHRRSISTSPVTAIFHVVVPSLLQIGAGLSHSRELRDIFEDLVDKVIAPLQSSACGTSDIDLLYNGLLQSYQQLSTLSPDLRTRFEPTLTRFVGGLLPVTHALFPSA
eukprot:m.1464721 g.1464721  ORF g.1464721 m.1464721 type:complete len:374 (-) comp25135_c0_seq8:4829-5950(-)